MDSSFNSPNVVEKTIKIHYSLNVNRVSIKYERSKHDTPSSTKKKTK